MKKNYCLLLFLLFSCLLIQAQEEEYEYTPFPDSNTIWSEYYEPPFGSEESPSYHALALFNEDTVINSITYQQLFRLYDTVLNPNKAEYIGGLREDTNKRIYCNMQEKGYPLKYMWYPSGETNENGEVLLYDFSLKQGDTLYGGNFALSDDFLVVTDIDTVFIHGKPRKKYHFQYDWQKWIEGIGNIRGLLFTTGTIPNNGIYNTLICLKHKGKQEYFNSRFDKCFPGLLTGTGKELSEGSVRIYPNPARETIYFERLERFNMLSIYSFCGKKVETRKIGKREGVSVSVNSYSPGMYIYKLTGLSGRYETGKFIVK
jgi:hypothetical protein